MSVRQLQIANDSIQDRLILRVATNNNEEIRVFITRRFLREIWPHLTRMLVCHLATPDVPAEALATPEPATFGQAFKEDNPTYPLGSTPLLASEVTFEGKGEEITRLIFREGRERSFALALNGELLQALCAMLRAASEQAEWNIDLNYETPSTIAAAPGKSLLH